MGPMGTAPEGCRPKELSCPQTCGKELSTAVTVTMLVAAGREAWPQPTLQPGHQTAVPSWRGAWQRRQDNSLRLQEGPGRGLSGGHRQGWPSSPQPQRAGSAWREHVPPEATHRCVPGRSVRSVADVVDG